MNNTVYLLYFYIPHCAGKYFSCIIIANKKAAINAASD